MDELDLRSATLIDELLWHDGPLLCSFERDGQLYVAAGSDRTGANPEVVIWLAAEVTPEDLVAFDGNRVTLRALLENAPALYEGQNRYYDHAAPAMRRIACQDVPEWRRPTLKSFLHPADPP